MVAVKEALENQIRAKMQIPQVKFQHQYEYNTKPKPSWFLKIDLKPKWYNFSTLMSTISK